ncbi:MAG: hypothetical protein V7K33_14315 [Nostoc sp.]
MPTAPLEMGSSQNVIPPIPNVQPKNTVLEIGVKVEEKIEEFEE